MPARNRWLRLLRHRWFDAGDARRALGADGLARVEARIAESESRHAGEIRVCVEAGLPLSYLWRNASARERALMMFGKLRVWDTERNSGVLIYLLLADHAIELVADRGISGRVPQADWQVLVDTLRENFRRGAYVEGLIGVIDRVEALLEQHLPLQAGETPRNELPDQVDLR